jgi:hypothetical protein
LSVSRTDIGHSCSTAARPAIDSLTSRMSPLSCEPRQQPLSGPARLSIDVRAHVFEHLGHVLDLVQDRGRPHAVQEPLRVAPEPCDKIRVLEQVILRAREQPAQQVGFPGPPRPGQEQRREGLGRTQDLRAQLALDMPHG